MENTKNSRDAAKLDRGSYWVEFDYDSNMFGVFGTETGFCYYLGNEESCKSWIDTQAKA